jgi:threonine/homoserine/homoserine lactone efflux protein
VSATPALLAAAAGVAVGHAVLPDHWVPLAVVGRTQLHSLARTTRLATLAGVAHVLTSLLVGGIIIAVGLQLRSAVEGVENLVVGGLLIATGVGFVAFELVVRRHGRHHHDHDAGAHAPEQRDAAAADRSGPSGASDGGTRLRGAAVMVPFGAAASPDLTILPVFLAATALGVAPAVGTLLTFSFVTIVAIVALTVSASVGSRRLAVGWLDRWGNLLTALVLIGIGGLVLTGVI